MEKHGHQKSEFYGDFSYLKSINEAIATKIAARTKKTCFDQMEIGLGFNGWKDELDNLFLDGLESIDLASAKLLKQSNAKHLYLGVHTIDPRVLYELRLGIQWIFFTNLKSFSENSMSVLLNSVGGHNDQFYPQLEDIHSDSTSPQLEDIHSNPPQMVNIPSDCEISEEVKKNLDSGYREFPILRISSVYWPKIISKIKTFIIKTADNNQKYFWEISNEKWWLNLDQEYSEIDNSQPSILPSLSVDE